MATEITAAEGRSATALYIAALLVVALGVGLVATMGLPGLGVFGLIGTAVIMVLLLAFAVGA